MAYVAGLYTGASQAAADEAQRFRQFQTQIDEMSARERAAALRQQQAAMDRQMAGLVQPGQLYTPETLPGVAPKPAQFPTGTAVPEQVVAPSLTAPAPAPAAAAAPGAASRAGLAGLPPYVVDTSPRAPAAPTAFAGGYRPLPPLPTDAPETRYSKFEMDFNLGPEQDAARKKQKFDRITQYLTKPRTLGGVFYELAIDTAENAKLAQEARIDKRIMADWYKENRDRIMGDPALLEEASRNPLAFYKKNNPYVRVSPAVEQEFTPVSETAAPAAGGPTPVADAVAAGTAAAPGQAQEIPAPDSMGVTNVSATAPLQVPAAVPVRDEAFAAQSAAKLESEFIPRVAEVPQMMTTGTVQQLVRRATELGVDPAAAVAIYGVETNFGRRVGVSEKGARGLMQVTPATFEGMKRFFTDPAEIERYNIPQALVDAAANMSADDENSFDAGLLRMKYAEYKGVDKNLLGAGYNASAETIARLGRPLATGAGITNEDYNKAYIALYNEARNYVGLEANMPMRDFEGAPLRLQELDANEQIEVTNYNNDLNLLQQQNQRILDQRNIIAQQISFAQQSGFFNQIPGLQRQLVELDSALMGVTQQANQLNAGYQTKFNDFNMQRTREFGNIAVGRMLGGDPAPLSEMWSRAYGQPVTIQRRSDGKYNIFMGEEGRRVSPADGMTPDQVATEFRVQFDDAYAAQEAERRQKERDAAVQHDRKLQELMIQQVGDIEVAKINKAPVPGFSEPKAIRKDANGNDIEFISFGEGPYTGQIIRFRSPPQQELKDGILTIDQAIITRELAPGIQ